jgi:hypothetical protein
VPDPVRVQVVQAGPDAGRAAQLTAVRGEEQRRPGRDAERDRELGRAATPLVVAQPEPDHPAARVLRGQPGQRPRLQRVLGPVGRDDQADAHPGRGGRRVRRVQHQLHRRGETAEALPVAGRVDLDLQPAGPLGPLVLRSLAEQPAHVLRGAQHRPRDVVQPLEPEPAALVGRAQPGRPGPGQRFRQVHPVLRGQVDQGGVPHRPGEVQVQVRLGQRGDRPRHQRARSLNAPR